MFFHVSLDAPYPRLDPPLPSFGIHDLRIHVIDLDKFGALNSLRGKEAPKSRLPIKRDRMDIYNRCHRIIFSIEHDLRRILMIERRLANLSISYNQTSMNSLHTDLKTISSKGNHWCLAPKSEQKNYI